MTYRVVFTPEAEDHLDELYRYIADASTPDIADFTASAPSACSGTNLAMTYVGAVRRLRG